MPLNYQCNCLHKTVVLLYDRYDNEAPKFVYMYHNDIAAVLLFHYVYLQIFYDVFHVNFNPIAYLTNQFAFASIESFLLDCFVQVGLEVFLLVWHESLRFS